MEDHSNEELIELARCGDQAAMRILIVRLNPIVYARVYRLSNDHLTAEDLSQDVLIVVLRNVQSGRLSDLDRSMLSPWVRGVANHIWMHYVKGRRIRAENMSEAQLAELIGREPDPSTQADEHELAARLGVHIQNLTFTCRQAITLYYWEGLNCREMADHLGEPQGTVQWRLHRARELLKASIIHDSELLEWINDLGWGTGP